GAVVRFINQPARGVTESQFFAGVVEPAGQWSERLEAELGIERSGILRDDDEAARGKKRVGGKDKLLQGPVSKVHIAGRGIVQLDEFQRPCVGRVKKKLVDDHAGRSGGET